MDCARFTDIFGYRAPEWQLSAAQIVGRVLDQQSLAV
jgi:hypothetical protein